jgi:hypothetical protein
MAPTAPEGAPSTANAGEWPTYLFRQSASLIVAPFASDDQTQDDAETAADTTGNTAGTTGNEDGTPTSAP